MTITDRGTNTTPDPARHLAVDQPIINSPFIEPRYHWVYQKGEPVKAPGRREAGFYFRERRTGDQQLSMFQEEVFNPLPEVNEIRQRVNAWRENGYRGVTSITLQLLAYWNAPDRERRLFFCQREAAETLIWLLETDPGRDMRHRIPADGDLMRYACKMATGSGKTVVMAMMAAWSILNRAHAPGRSRFADAILVLCPNLTVKERLGGAPRAVAGSGQPEPRRPLIPGAAGNYYEQFDLVPSGLLPALGQGRVHITNWHDFLTRDDGRRRGIVQRGPESDAAFCARVLHDLGGARNILVLNDEAHHAYRPRTDRDELADADDVSTGRRRARPAVAPAGAREENEAATVWISGLDRIRGVRGIVACLDFSATPFYIDGSGYPPGTPFPWLVSDFGLVDAIESGIVKVPRVPVADAAGRSEPQYFRLWAHIMSRLQPHERGGARRKPSPEAVVREADGALQQLAGEWAEAFLAMQRQGYTVPPCLIVVCDNTDISELVYEKIAVSGGVQGEYLANRPGREVALRIDTKLLNAAESETDVGSSREDRAQVLRQKVATVGRAGEPGGEIRCVVSVAMLTEGWDAQNVTHILGLRAFDSQLLCEQVVGRGLRRMNYDFDLNEEGIPTLVEYVDVYGIPFEVIPVQKRTTAPPPPPKETTLVQAIPERAALHRIEFPRVDGYVFHVEDKVTADIDEIDPIRLSQDVAPTATVVRARVGYQEGGPALRGPGESETQTREQFYASVRPQQIAFELARRVIERLLVERDAFRYRARHLLFPQVLAIVRDFLDRRVDYGSANPREVGLEAYMQPITDRLTTAITPSNATGKPTILPRLERFRPRGSTAEVAFRTTRECRQTEKSHIGHVVLDTTTWEASVAFQLEASPLVQTYARNDHLELAIPYDFLGHQHRYYPDFVVRLANGAHLLLEVKGYEVEQDRQKHTAARRWAGAVTAWGEMGAWYFDVCMSREDVPSILAHYAALASAVA